MPKPIFDEKRYISTKENAKKLYDAFKATKCKALGDQVVVFNAEGFNHLIYTKRKERGKFDQIGRLNCLYFAPKILELTTTIQETQEGMIDTVVKKYGKKVTETKTIKYWAFIAIMGDRRIKVVVRKIGNGQIEFRSICPIWKTKRYGNAIVRELSTEDLEEA